jgi:hypothetical protein
VGFFWFIFIVAALIYWVFYGSKGRDKHLVQFNQGARAPKEQDASTIDVSFNAPDAEEAYQAYKATLIKWSGKDTGPFAIKALTVTQDHCLRQAQERKRIIPGDSFGSNGEVPPDVSFHSQRTVDSLVKHGFLEADGKGTYRCTDHGARACEQLPIRLS